MGQEGIEMEDECDLMAFILVCFTSKSGRVSRKMTSALTLILKKRIIRILIVVANALPYLENYSLRNDENKITTMN